MDIGFQTTSPHGAIIDVQRRQARDCPMPFVYKRTAHELSWAHRLGGHAPGQRLHMGFFIQTQHHCASLIEPGHPRIPPQDASSLGDASGIDGRGLPRTTAMRRQAGGGQAPSDGRLVPRVRPGLLHDYWLQTPAIPARHLQSIGARVRACDTLDQHALQRGKTGAAAHGARHQRWRRLPTLGSVAISPRAPCGSTPARAPSRRCAPPGPMPQGPERDLPRVEPGVYRQAYHVNIVDRRRVCDTAMVFVPSSDALRPARAAVWADQEFVSMCTKTFATVH
jgi:hypothetical protein